MTQEFNTIYTPQNDEEASNNAEGIENCVTKNLFTDLFAVDDDELLADETIYGNILKYQDFLEPRHLELNTNRL